MGDVSILTQASNAFRWRTVNATDNGFPTKAPTGTQPAESKGTNVAQATSAAVRHLTGEGRSDGKVQNRIHFAFYGAGSDTNTFLARLIHWKLITEGSRDTELWVPVPLFEVTATLSTPVGVAGRLVVATDRFADTIALTSGTANDDIDVSIASPANNTIAHMSVDMKGPHVLEVIFTTGGSATSCNALSWYD